MSKKPNQTKRVSDLGEFGLIDLMSSILTPKSPEIIVGLGDDCATIQTGSKPMIVTVDAMIQDIHFRTHWTSAEDVAYKLMASNISDLAAKCADPAFGVITLGLPGTTEVSWVESFYRSLHKCCSQWPVDIIGGDTVSSPQIVLSLTLWGYQTTDFPLLVRNAKVGDAILVTGTLGDAAAGLEILMNNDHQSMNTYPYLLERFHRPTPRIQEALQLAKLFIPASMTDISDGLARDLKKLCSASQTGACLYTDSLPCSKDLKEYAQEKAVEMMWKGGEDYELLFTLPNEQAQSLLETWNHPLCPLSIIGEMVEPEQGIRFDRSEISADPGFDHFF